MAKPLATKAVISKRTPIQTEKINTLHGFVSYRMSANNTAIAESIEVGTELTLVFKINKDGSLIKNAGNDKNCFAFHGQVDGLEVFGMLTADQIKQFNIELLQSPVDGRVCFKTQVGIYIPPMLGKLESISIDSIGGE